MPFTFNGVGTRYAGRSNLSVAQGTCPSCGRFVRLSSYDTRECFCFLYIPLIPLRKFRIMHDCPVCRRHGRIPLDQFQRELSAQIEPLRQAARQSSGDPETHVRLVEGLTDFRMLAEAAQAARDGLALHPRHARLNLLAGKLAAVQGDSAGAIPFYRQAAAATPGDPAIRTVLGQHLLARGETAEAARELGEAQRLDPSNAQVSYLLGQTLARDQRWAEALGAFEAAAARDPALAADRDLLRRMAECKRALGFPLTDQERKAGRRWWPFRRSPKPSASRRPALFLQPWRIGLLFGLVIALLAVFFVGGALWKQRRADVYFDNGLRKRVQVTVGNETFSLPPGMPVKKALDTGRHTVRVSGPQGEIEQATIEIPALGFFDALVEDRLFVYNVAAARVYQREEIGYAEAESDRTYKRTLIGLQRFFEQDGVDYVFEKAPGSITIDSGSHVEVKVALNGTPLDLNQLGVAWYKEGKKREAERALRKAVETDGCAGPARANLLHVLLDGGQKDAAVTAARKWVADCPDAGVVPHRAYQSTLLGLGRRDEVVAEYRARLDAHPEVGANHYLYGRLLEDPARTLPLYREAVRRDPQLPWAHGAIAYDLMKLEQDAEAMDHLEASLRLPGHDQSYVVDYAMAAVGAGATARAEEVLKTTTKATGEDGDQLWRARWLLALAGGRYDDAEKRLRQRTAAGAAGEEDAKTWGYRLQLARLRGDEAETAKALLAGKRWPDAADTLCGARMERALEAGDYAEAARIAEEAKTENLMLQLYAAAAQLMAGDRKGAEARLHDVERKLGPDPQETGNGALRSLARYLRGEGKAESALLASRLAGFEYLPHAYFLLGARAAADGDAARARAWFEKSRARSLDLDFPYFAATARAKG
ncbi:MAG TPA: tetratricopeptide repeat protein [Thermoanaerobaculia bacterium]|jgi:predicted Zn-dependent protease